MAYRMSWVRDEVRIVYYTITDRMERGTEIPDCEVVYVVCFFTQIAQEQDR
jgi:hypothetical protein